MAPVFFSLTEIAIILCALEWTGNTPQNLFSTCRFTYPPSGRNIGRGIIKGGEKPGNSLNFDLVRIVSRPKHVSSGAFVASNRISLVTLMHLYLPILDIIIWKKNSLSPINFFKILTTKKEIYLSIICHKKSYNNFTISLRLNVGISKKRWLLTFTICPIVLILYAEFFSLASFLLFYLYQNKIYLE